MEKKQKEILQEIVESDQKYLEDLRMINSFFITPMTDTNQLSSVEKNDIFNNILMIIKIHERIGEALSLKFPTHQQNLQNMIDAYSGQV